MIEKKEALKFQKLELDLQNHVKQDETAFVELKTMLQSIVNSLDSIKESISSYNTQLAVLKTQVETHLREHEQNKWTAGTIAAVVGVIVSILAFLVQHFVFK